MLPDEGEAAEIARQICAAMELLLRRSHIDSRLLVELCGGLKAVSELPFPKLLKGLDKALRLLDVPAGSWISKNMRAARVIESHPSLSELADIEALCALDRLPEGSLKKPDESGHFVVGEEKLDIRSASKKEILSAVRKVKSEESKVRKKNQMARSAMEEKEGSLLNAESIIENGSALESEAESPSDIDKLSTRPIESEGIRELGPAFVSELSAAELVISRLISSLPQDKRLKELAAALENTRILVAYAREDLRGPLGNQNEESRVDMH